jgi:hypothetical protein
MIPRPPAHSAPELLLQAGTRVGTGPWVWEVMSLAVGQVNVFLRQSQSPHRLGADACRASLLGCEPEMRQGL